MTQYINSEAATAQQLPSLNPGDQLTGTRPSKICIGSFQGNNVYGILLEDDTFTLSPGRAGFGNINLESVLADFGLNDLKEYCRARQHQIDCGETDEQRPGNKATAAHYACTDPVQNIGGGGGKPRWTT